jgi:hypothetical protein
MAPIRKNVTISEDHKLHLDLELPAEVPVGEAEVTVVVSPAKHPNMAKAVECLRELSRCGGVSSIAEPSAWQHETRRDRSLPGRE